MPAADQARQDFLAGAIAEGTDPVRAVRRPLESDSYHAGDRDRCRGGQSGRAVPYLRYADDAINMPCQASTQWDALCHIFMDDKMYNGHDASLVDARGAKKNGIEHVRDKMAAARAARHGPP